MEKADVLTLKGILEDIGADRGIIFSESGFQSGARDATRNTNILLVSSLEEFKTTATLDQPRATLVLQPPDQVGIPPVFAFPHGDQPQHLLVYGDLVFLANWQTGNIAAIDPSKKSVEGVIHLDKYETRPRIGAERKISTYPPGEMACADGKLFVGQVFSEFILVIDIATQCIIKRINVPGGGEGSISSSKDGQHIYFASNRINSLFIIDTATYDHQLVPYPTGGRGCMCVLSHPSKPLLYIGIQRGGTLEGNSYRGGNCFLATYNLDEGRYIGNLYLAEVEHGQSDDATPACITYDERVVHAHVPVSPARQHKRVFETVSHRIERAALRFRRSHLPEGTCLIFVWPYVAIVRTTARRHELLRVLHASIDGADMQAPGQAEALT